MQRRIISYIKQVVNDVCSNYHTPRHREALQVVFFFSRLKKKVHRIFLPNLDRKGSGGVFLFFLFLFPLMFDEACTQARPLGACMHGTGGTPGKNTVALVQLSLFARLQIRDRRIVVGGSDSLEYCRPAHARPLENAFDLWTSPVCSRSSSQSVSNQPGHVHESVKI